MSNIRATIAVMRGMNEEIAMKGRFFQHHPCSVSDVSKLEQEAAQFDAMLDILETMLKRRPVRA